jgi:hypothetical protein
VKEAEGDLRRDSIQKLFEVYHFNKNQATQPPQPSANSNLNTKSNTTAAIPTTNGNDEIVGKGITSQVHLVIEGDDSENVRD